MRIPVITMYDYEFTETRIFNRFSDKVLIPSQISDTTLDKIGLSTAKRVKYEGIKEELYIRNFEPRTDFRRDFFKSQIVGRNSPESILVVVRPPATTANYHSERSEKLFDDVMRLLAATKNAFTVVMPRTREQEETVRSLIAGIPDSDNCMVLSKAVDGLNLTFAADVLISGGGTMNREAALLGVPVYSIFAGKLGALDAAMEKEGSIRFIRKSEDLGKIRLKRRRATGESRNSLTDRVESFVINQIDSFLDAKEKR